MFQILGGKKVKVVTIPKMVYKVDDIHINYKDKRQKYSKMQIEGIRMSI